MCAESILTIIQGLFGDSDCTMTVSVMALGPWNITC